SIILGILVFGGLIVNTILCLNIPLNPFAEKNGTCDSGETGVAWSYAIFLFVFVTLFYFGVVLANIIMKYS
ncbi:MAG: hypothetical protein J6A01_11670, partial [Proteobacteria bacterium]|nr:hypothetical protein [Pseudomonadota bacterium]